MPNRPIDETEVVGSIIGDNPSNSPTDRMVNQLAEAERAMKDERRSQWLNMNQSSATNVLANLGAELPAHLRQEQVNPAANVMAGAMGQTVVDGPSEALLRRICEVAVRRVARKRGVAVETPQSSAEGDQLNVTVTYVDDGRVLDTPEDLAQAFEHSIQTELALKGYDYSASISLFCSKEGEIEKLIGEGSEEVVEEEMFACEICDGLVKESDNECPHCGAMFEDEDAEPSAPNSNGPPGPSKSGGPPGQESGGPPGPKKSGGPPGQRSQAVHQVQVQANPAVHQAQRSQAVHQGPKKSGGPPGPSKSGGPSGQRSQAVHQVLVNRAGLQRSQVVHQVLVNRAGLQRSQAVHQVLVSRAALQRAVLKVLSAARQDDIVIQNHNHISNQSLIDDVSA